jgi:hypothetical protein
MQDVEIRDFVGLNCPHHRAVSGIHNPVANRSGAALELESFVARWAVVVNNFLIVRAFLQR